MIDALPMVFRLAWRCSICVNDLLIAYVSSLMAYRWSPDLTSPVASRVLRVSPWVIAVWFEFSYHSGHSPQPEFVVHSNAATALLYERDERPTNITGEYRQIEANKARTQSHSVNIPDQCTHHFISVEKIQSSNYDLENWDIIRVEQSWCLNNMKLDGGSLHVYFCHLQPHTFHSGDHP